MTNGGIELAPGIFVPETAVRLQFARGSGPGGQNVNKVNTKAELWVELNALRAKMTHGAIERLKLLCGSRLTDVGEIHLSSHSSRSQEANKHEVFDRLREMIIAARVEPKKRKKTKPSRAAKQRRLDSKKRRSQIVSNRRSDSD